MCPDDVSKTMAFSLQRPEGMVTDNHDGDIKNRNWAISRTLRGQKTSCVPEYASPNTKSFGSAVSLQAASKLQPRPAAGVASRTIGDKYVSRHYGRYSLHRYEVSKNGIVCIKKKNKSYMSWIKTDGFYSGMLLMAV